MGARANGGYYSEARGMSGGVAVEHMRIACCGECGRDADLRFISHLMILICYIIKMAEGA